MATTIHHDHISWTSTPPLYVGWYLTTVWPWFERAKQVEFQLTKGAWRWWDGTRWSIAYYQSAPPASTLVYPVSQRKSEMFWSSLWPHLKEDVRNMRIASQVQEEPAVLLDL